MPLVLLTVPIQGAGRGGVGAADQYEGHLVVHGDAADGECGDVADGEGAGRVAESGAWVDVQHGADVLPLSEAEHRSEVGVERV